MGGTPYKSVKEGVGWVLLQVHVFSHLTMKFTQKEGWALFHETTVFQLCIHLDTCTCTYMDGCMYMYMYTVGHWVKGMDVVC